MASNKTIHIPDFLIACAGDCGGKTPKAFAWFYDGRAYCGDCAVTYQESSNDESPHCPSCGSDSVRFERGTWVCDNCYNTGG